MFGCGSLIFSLTLALLIVGRTASSPGEHQDEDGKGRGGDVEVDVEVRLESSKVDSGEDPAAITGVPYVFGLRTTTVTSTFSIVTRITTYPSCYTTLAPMTDCIPGETTVTTIVGRRKRRRRKSEHLYDATIDTFPNATKGSESTIRATKVQQSSEESAATDELEDAVEEEEEEEEIRPRIKFVLQKTTTVTASSSVVVEVLPTQTLAFMPPGCLPTAFFDSQGVIPCDPRQ